MDVKQRKTFVLVFCCVTVVPALYLAISATMAVQLGKSFKETVLGNLIND